MNKKSKTYGKNIKRVKLFLSLEPARFLEGTVTIPSAKSRLSDLLNDDRAYLAIQDVTVPEGWFALASKFVLLNKKEIKAIVEID